MEILRMLGDCYKGNSSVKKTFCWVGFSKLSQLDKPIKDMNKEEEFSCIMNWIMHKMPKRKAVIIRFDVCGITYQVKISHNGQRLCVNKPTLITTIDEATFYDWQGEKTYRNLTVEKICNSIQGADQKNKQKEQRERQELMELFANAKAEESQAQEKHT